MAFKRPSVQFCPAPPDILKAPDHHTDDRGFCIFGLVAASLAIDAEADALCQARHYSATRNEPAPAPDTTNEACTLPVIFRNHVQHGGQNVAPVIGHD